MTCEACTSSRERLCAMFHAGCPGCMARSAARSPQFRQSRDAGRITHGYRLLLQTYYGADCDIGKANEQVKAAAAADFEQKEQTR